MLAFGLTVHHPAVALCLLPRAPAVEIIFDHGIEIGERHPFVGYSRPDHYTIVRILEHLHPIGRLTGDERYIEIGGELASAIEAIAEDQHFPRAFGHDFRNVRPLLGLRLVEEQLRVGLAVVVLARAILPITSVLVPIRSVAWSRRVRLVAGDRLLLGFHVGLVLIDRLLTALANRLDDPSAHLRRTKPG